MGGSKGDSSSDTEWFEQTKCQICYQTSHLALKCPFMYSTCRKCNGIRRVWTSNTERNPDRQFLRCRYPQCEEFQLLDEAIMGCMSVVGSSSSPKQHNAKGCFHRGSSEHWKRDCPSTSSPSKNKRIARKSGKKDLKGATTKKIIETTFDELCNKLTSGCNLNK